MINFILNNFDTIFKNETSLETLDKLILDLAIKGKLVEQDPSDEPASELIKRIKAEKQRLIDEKVIKKEKPLPPIEDEEIPFDIPNSWEWVRFVDLCSVLTCGYASTPKYEKTGKAFISAKNVKPYKFLLDDYKFISEELYSKLTANTKPEKGDILLTRVGAGIGEATIIDVDLDFAIYVSLTLIKLIKNKVVAKYILLYINSPFFRELMIESTFGKNTSQGNLNVKKLRELPIPLPPLKEQKRIVSKVEKLQSIIKDLKEIYIKNQNNRENLKKSLLSEIESQSSDKDLLKNLDLIFANFDKIIKTKEDIKDIRNLILSLAIKGKLVEQDPSDEPASELLKRIKGEKERLIKEKVIKKEKSLPSIKENEVTFDIPNSWEWTRLGNIIDIINGVSYQKKEVKNEKEKDYIFVIRGGNIKDNKFIDIPDNVYVPKENAKEDQFIKKGDTLMVSSSGTLTSVGKSIFVDENKKDTVIGAFLLILRPNLNINSKYIYNYFKIIREKIINDLKGTTIGNIKRSVLENYLIPLPPLKEQKRIVSKVESLIKICDLLEEKITLNEKISDKLLESILKN